MGKRTRRVVLPPEYALARKMRGGSQLERVRAARAFLEGVGNRDGNAPEWKKAAAFMGIFHPGHPATDAVIAEIREHEARR